MNTKRLILMLVIIIGTGFSGLLAQDSSKTIDSNSQHNNQNQTFTDNDGDGYNDNAPDHDGDGIPNGLDADWIKLKKEQQKNKRHRFVDLDGDGIDDTLQGREQNSEQTEAGMKANTGSMDESNRQQQKGQKKQYQKGRK